MNITNGEIKHLTKEQAKLRIKESTLRNRRKRERKRRR
jgi:hypothetical protein